VAVDNRKVQVLPFCLSVALGRFANTSDVCQGPTWAPLRSRTQVMGTFQASGFIAEHSSVTKDSKIRTVCSSSVRVSWVNS
jgi:hypothetical protein